MSRKSTSEMNIKNTLFAPVGWLTKLAEEHAKKGITAQRIRYLEMFENFIKTGTLRVLYCLYNAPMRYSELEYMTRLRRPVLQKLLKHFTNLNLIETEIRTVDKPRNEKVTFYKLTKRATRLFEPLLLEGDIDAVMMPMKLWLEETGGE